MANKPKSGSKASSRSGSTSKTSAKKKTTSTKKSARKSDVKRTSRSGKKSGASKKPRTVSAAKYLAISILLIALAVFVVMCYAFPNWCGAAGPIIRDFLFGILGGGAILVPILFFVEAIFVKSDAKEGKTWSRPVFSLIGAFTFSALLHAAFVSVNPEMRINITQINADVINNFYNTGVTLTSGGVVGGVLGTLIMSLIGGVGTIILAVLLILFSAIFVFGFTPGEIVRKIRYKYTAHKEKSSIKKHERAEKAAVAQEERIQAEAIARKREERRRIELAEQEREKREREAAEEREIERMRQNAQAHTERAQEIRREMALAKKASQDDDDEDEVETDETPRVRAHGDIDDIFRADLIDSEEPDESDEPEDYEEPEDDKEFHGQSVEDFWRKEAPDSETTFEYVPDITVSDDDYDDDDDDEGDAGEDGEPDEGEFEGAAATEPEETGELDVAQEVPFESDTYESALYGAEDAGLEAPEAEESLPEDVIPWEEVTGEKKPDSACDDAEAELRRTLEVARKREQESAPAEPVEAAPGEAEPQAGVIAAAEAEAQEPEAPAEPEEPAYVFPPLDLLEGDPNEGIDGDYSELQESADKLIETLKNFNVKAKVVDIFRGPTITRFELALAAGTRVRTITNLSEDIALALATNGVRIGNIPGKSAIGIEVPNTGKRDTVYLRSLLEDERFTGAKSKLTAALGKNVSGENVYLDIAKMPHLLIAGTTGSGKSVCINTMLISLLYKATPDEVKLVLVDPKKVELNIYNGIPHLLVPVVFDPKKAAGALHWCVTEMERRFDLIESMNVRNLEGYNKAIADDPTKEKLPQIVIVIDELADLMMTASNEVETSICRIAQKARAAGMHLIIGTQRPSVDVITGLIKANVPSRIAFTVMSQVDSRTIIDQVGAEKLIGRGDMLFAPVGSKPLRAQGAFVSDAELEGIIEFIKENAKKAEYSKDIMSRIEKEAALCGKKGKARDDADDAMEDDEAEETDPKLDAAIKLAVESGKISTSLIQRKLSLGYGRAAKLIDTMERRGIVSPQEGQKPRQVLITKEQYLEMTMRSGGAARMQRTGEIPAARMQRTGEIPAARMQRTGEIPVARMQRTGEIPAARMQRTGEIPRTREDFPDDEF